MSLSKDRLQKENDIADLVSLMLLRMGYNDNPNSETVDPNLIDTPRRFAQYMMEFAAWGKEADKPILTTFPAESNGLIHIKGLEVRSLCAHHLAPFIGTAEVAYFPAFELAGLSKFQRVLDYHAKRLQNQERLTKQFIDTLNESIKPMCMAVKITAQHTCMSVRGVCVHGSETSTVEYCFGLGHSTGQIAMVQKAIGL